MSKLVSEKLIVKSPAFENNKDIPSKYTPGGDNVNPPLKIENLPDGTKSLALIMEDPDSSDNFVHWLMWNIPPAKEIKEHTAPGVEGLNSNRQNIYTGPNPPSGAHRYFFKIYALDAELDLSTDSTKRDLESAMQGHILAKGELIGIYNHEAPMK